VNGESTDLGISDWRKKIDALDEQIVQFINQRAQAAIAIGDLKHESNLPVYEPKREQAVFEHVRRVNQGPLPDSEMQHIFERIMDVMRSLQRREQ
jgi:chorismate mutase